LHKLTLICGVVSLLSWLYLLLFHGRFWQVSRLPPAKLPESPISGTIAVVIPARNEVENIGRAVRSLLNQSCLGLLEIYVVDDNSTDGTAEAARSAAADHPSKLTVIEGCSLPSGWTGKLWAVQQGVEVALTAHPEFLLLTDADIEHAPDNIATLVSIAAIEGYDLVSMMVKLQCQSLAEKLLIPAFVFFFFMLYPPLWIRSRHKRIAGAAGGCMLIRPEALERVGGIAAIRSEIIDDCALARRVKDSGGRVWLGVADRTRSLRSYTSFSQIKRMIARTAFNQLRHSAVLLFGAVVGMTVIFLLPLVLLLSGKAPLIALGLAAYGLMVVAYLPMVRFYGLAAGWALVLPFSALFYMTATVDSAIKFWSGRGGEWKGRAQDLSSSK
jgi:hopene-associated glycosyltransferase HpnB